MSDKYLNVITRDNLMVITMKGTGEESWGTSRMEHRLSPGMVEELHHSFDEAIKREDIKGVVLTGDGRFWSNGFDLKWAAKVGTPETIQQLQFRLESLLAKILVFPLPTVAILNGHTTAAGSMMALAFDTRVMNKDKGWFFVPGINIGLVYTPGMTQLMMQKTPQQMHNHFIAQGSRFSGKDLYSLGVVEAICSPSTLFEDGFSVALNLSKKVKYPNFKDTMHRIKINMYEPTYKLLKDSTADLGMSKL